MSGVEVARLDGGSVSLSDATLDAFAADFHGFVARSGEAGYDEARLIWNGMFKRHPGLVLRCLGTAGVMAAVRFAREHGLLVAVRGGGHSMAGRSVIDDGLLIDLSLMRAVRVDPTNNHVYAQGGARLVDIDQEGQAYGLGVPSGVVGTTGVAGLTLGGGTGWQMRKHGLSRRQPPLGRDRDRGRRGADRKRERERGSLLGRPRRRWQFRDRHDVRVSGPPARTPTCSYARRGFPSAWGRW